MSRSSSQSGFTAVELLVTLFVAAAFLVASYQLYTLVIREGGSTRAEARAASIAKEYLERYRHYGTDPCEPAILVNNGSIEIEGASNATLSATLTCPNPSTPRLSKVEVSIETDVPEAEYVYATMAYNDTDPLTVGLVGWWTLNGNAEDSSDSEIDGTVTNATLTTGQNGIAGNAYAFETGGARIDLGNHVEHNQTEVTMSAWVYPTSSSGTRSILAKEGVYKYRLTTNGIAVLVSANSGWTINYECAYTFTPNTWYHTAFTLSGEHDFTRLYVNGSEVCETTGPDITSFDNSHLYIGTYNSGGSERFVGNIDDARVYNRVLDELEISLLHAQGAR